ncbi:MAG: N-acetylneuraminate synthase [Alphaproteobacteria bacterium]
MKRCYVIAEAGVNHNGSADMALRLVDAGAEAGADAVKFQTFDADLVVTPTASKAAYQKQATDAGECQYDMLRKLELSCAAQHDLLARCRQRRIDFLSTPFDPESLDFLVDELGLETIKIASGEITNAPLLMAAGHKARRIILSTGMSTLDEVEQALGILAFAFTGGESPDAGAFAEALRSPEGQAALRDRVTLLHCTSAYPTPPTAVNLRAMDTLRGHFGLNTGLSDHSAGIAVAIAAVARGAAVIEKHFTLDRGLPGPDHAASLEPDMLTAMIDGIRIVEQALGDGRKAPAEAELCNIPLARRALVAARPIKAGEPFTTENLIAKRPARGISPMQFWDVLGRTALRDFATDEPIDL